MTTESEPGKQELALFAAAKNGDTERLSFLLAAGVDVNVRDQIVHILPGAGFGGCGRFPLVEGDGKTALMYAAKNGHEPAVRLLLERGADIDAKSNSGRTALDLAERNGHRNIVALLRVFASLRKARRPTAHCSNCSAVEPT